MYVPTRREVYEMPADWLYPVLIDWMWESPSELIPARSQISQVRDLLLLRPDRSDPGVQPLVSECNDYLTSAG